MTATLTETSVDAAELERLAAAYNNGELDGYEAQQAVDHIAHPTLTPDQAWTAFKDLAQAIDDRERLEDGVIDWSAIDPTLPAHGQDDDTAHDIVQGQITDALDTLTGSNR